MSDSKVHLILCAIPRESCESLVLTEKKMHNLKAENYILFGGQN